MPTRERAGVFETNSSSTHAVAIKGGKFRPEFHLLHPDTQGVTRVYPGEFGWGPSIHHDAATKASYALTWIDTVCPEDKRSYLLARLRKLIAEETGATEVRFLESADEGVPHGYIDHQSGKDLGWKGPGGEIFATVKATHDFIFNPKSFLVIDNDNH